MRLFELVQFKVHFNFLVSLKPTVNFNFHESAEGRSVVTI